jgi:VanZ family protein
VGILAGEKWPGWMVAVGTFGLGVGIEVAQRFVPGRGFEWLDVEADAVGVGLGWALGAAAAWMLRRLGRGAEKGAAGASR